MRATTDAPAGQDAALNDWMRELSAHYPFGPLFLATQLGGLIRQRCPDLSEGLPTVQVHLQDGERLDLCHVIGFAPLWAAFAVWEEGFEAMRTELVPYGAIARVTIAAPRGGHAGIGFDQSRVPAMLHHSPMSPEQAMQTAAARRDDSS